jgi:hypothetical protein
MEKYKLLGFVKKLSRLLKDKTPTQVFNTIKDDSFFGDFGKILKQKDLIYFCLLVPRFNMGSNIDEDYDNIELNLFSVDLVEIYDTHPMVTCSECEGGGFDSCDNCDGDGEEECRYCDNTGEQDCEYCEGSGQDEEDQDCGNCEGDGKENCYRCHGRGYESCSYCDGDGKIQCQNCEGDGETESDTLCEISINEFVCWNEKWKMFFASKNYDEEIEYNDYNNFTNSKQTLQLSYETDLSDEYVGADNGNVYITSMNEKPEFN